MVQSLSSASRLTLSPNLSRTCSSLKKRADNLVTVLLCDCLIELQQIQIKKIKNDNKHVVNVSSLKDWGLLKVREKCNKTYAIKELHALHHHSSTFVH